MKKLVIGGSGHIGAHLVRCLLSEKQDVKVMVRKTSSLKGLAGLDIEIVYGDVLDSNSLANAMMGCDGVFHLGAPTSLGSKTSETILEGTKQVLILAHRLNISKIVYTSSIVTIGYSTDRNVVLDETHNQFTPASDYHISKYHAERFALDFAKEKGVPVVVVNPATVIGSLDFRITPSNLPIQQCLNRGLPFVFDSGVTVVHAQDVARGHVQAYLYGRPGERYILGGTRVTMKDYFRLISKLCGRPGPYLKIPRIAMLFLGLGFGVLQKAGFTNVPFNYNQANQLVGKYGWYSSKKAEVQLGYTWRPLEDSIKSYIEWFKTTAELNKKNNRQDKK